MNLSEINQQIIASESKIDTLQKRLQKCKNMVSTAFSGNDNWREKESIGKMIKPLEGDIAKESKDLALLKSEREVLLKQEVYNKEVIAQQAQKQKKLEEDKIRFSISNPISMLEIE